MLTRLRSQWTMSLKAQETNEAGLLCQLLVTWALLGTQHWLLGVTKLTLEGWQCVCVCVRERECVWQRGGESHVTSVSLFLCHTLNTCPSSTITSSASITERWKSYSQVLVTFQRHPLGLAYHPLIWWSRESRELLFAHNLNFFSSAFFWLSSLLMPFTVDGICMWTAWGSSCWFEADCLSSSFTHDVWTVMLRCRPGGHNRNAIVVLLLLPILLPLCLKSEDLYISMLLLYLQNVSAHAHQVQAHWDDSKSTHRVQGNVDFLTDLLPLTRGGI